MICNLTDDMYIYVNNKTDDVRFVKELAYIIRRVEQFEI